MKQHKPYGYWTEFRCHEEALKYTNRKDFQFNSTPTYLTAWRKGWLDTICSHMEVLRTQPKHLTKEYCQVVARKYSYRTEFQINEPYIYRIACNNKWLADITSHMPARKPYTWFGWPKYLSAEVNQ